MCKCSNSSDGDGDDAEGEEGGEEGGGGSVGARCHLLMSSPGGARPNLSLSRGTGTRPCPVAGGFNSHERCQGVTAMFMLN